MVTCPEMTNSSGFSWTRTFETNRNLIASIENRFGTNLVSRFDYGNDSLARRTRRVDNLNVTNDFGYNDRSEVIGALMGTNRYNYDYDPIGNRLTATNNAEAWTYHANRLNQYTNIADGVNLKPEYDADGNMTAAGDGWVYVWNGENRMYVTCNDTTLVVNAYDYLGRRTTQCRDVSDGFSEERIETRRFIYDGWNLIGEIRTPDSGAVTTNWYVWGLDLSQSLQGAGGVGGLLNGAFGGTTSVSSVCYDGNGNVSELVGTNGTTLAHYEYDPFGNLTTETGSMAAANPFRFSTKYWDSDTKTLAYQLRDYSPKVGRWLSRDPIEEIGGLNLFAFTDNHPVSRFDALGLAGRIGDLGSKFTSYLEWFPEQGVGELKVIDPRGTEVMRFRYSNGTLTPVTEHGGRPLNGLSKRALEKIVPKLNQQLKIIVERAGGRWIAEMGVRPPPRIGGGAAVRGVGFWLLVASIVLEGMTADAAELPLPIIIPVSLEDAGITSEMFTESGQEGKVEGSVQSRRVNQRGEISACKRNFKIHTVQSGDTCWCLWQRRTNHSISWGQAHSEGAETSKSGNADNLEVGEDICIPE